MPLCTIFAKCPLPAGPVCTQPWSGPGASARTIGLRRASARGGAAEHQRIAVVESPDSAGHPGIDELDAARREQRSAPHRIPVIGVAAVDEQVPGIEQPREFGHRHFGHGTRRHHQPQGAGLRDSVEQFFQREGGAHADFRGKPFDGGMVPVESRNGDSAGREAPGHVGAHPAESDHTQLHRT